MKKTEPKHDCRKNGIATCDDCKEAELCLIDSHVDLIFELVYEARDYLGDLKLSHVETLRKVLKANNDIVERTAMIAAVLKAFLGEGK